MGFACDLFCVVSLEPAGGVEPPSLGYKARALPLSYAGAFGVCGHRRGYAAPAWVSQELVSPPWRVGAACGAVSSGPGVRGGLPEGPLLLDGGVGPQFLQERLQAVGVDVFHTGLVVGCPYGVGCGQFEQFGPSWGA